jgi:DNA-directed RNA polymerase subunit RPC12/RpoP
MPKFIRVYRCPDCGHKWRSETTRADYETDCPNCDFHVEALPDRIAAPAIVGTKSRAVDESYRIVSEDYELTNLRDNAKEGEASVILPTSGSQEMAELAGAMAAVPDQNRSKQAGGFMWGGAQGQTAGPIQFPTGGPIASARGGAAIANAEGRNPMKMLHEGRPKLRPLPVNKPERR